MNDEKQLQPPVSNESESAQTRDMEGEKKDLEGKNAG